VAFLQRLVSAAVRLPRQWLNQKIRCPLLTAYSCSRKSVSTRFVTLKRRLHYLSPWVAPSPKIHEPVRPSSHWQQCMRPEFLFLENFTFLPLTGWNSSGNRRKSMARWLAVVLQTVRSEITANSFRKMAPSATTIGPNLRCSLLTACSCSSEYVTRRS